MTRDAAVHRTHLTLPAVKDFPVQNVNGAEVEKPYWGRHLLGKRRGQGMLGEKEEIWYGNLTMSGMSLDTICDTHVLFDGECVSAQEIQLHSWVHQGPAEDICTSQIPHETHLIQDLLTKLWAGFLEMNKGWRSVLKKATVVSRGKKKVWLLGPSDISSYRTLQ